MRECRKCGERWPFWKIGFGFVRSPIYVIHLSLVIVFAYYLMLNPIHNQSFICKFIFYLKRSGSILWYFLFTPSNILSVGLFIRFVFIRSIIQPKVQTSVNWGESSLTSQHILGLCYLDSYVSMATISMHADWNWFILSQSTIILPAFLRIFLPIPIFFNILQLAFLMFLMNVIQFRSKPKDWRCGNSIRLKAYREWMLLSCIPSIVIFLKLILIISFIRQEYLFLPKLGVHDLEGIFFRSTNRGREEWMERCFFAILRLLQLLYIIPIYIFWSTSSMIWAISWKSSTGVYGLKTRQV